MLLIFYIILLPLLVSFCVVFINFITAPKLRGNSSARFCQEKPLLVSVLIPARNEEANIESCLKSVLSQNYNNMEIIVLDDNSEDNTARLAESAAGRDNRFKLIKGLPLASRWLGKNWACHQLSLHASGDILLFIDADVIISSNAVLLAIEKMFQYKLDMLSVFPTQIMKTIGEYMLVPMMNWFLLSFLPLRMVYTSKNKAFTAANGQFLMITRKAYKIINGHEAVFYEIVEDMSIARNLKKAGLKMMTVLGSKSVMCRMYKSFQNAYTGFSKNFFAGFNISSGKFRVLLLLLEAVFLLPFLIFPFYNMFILCMVLIVISRIMISVISEQNTLYNVLFHPLQLISLYIIGTNSVNIKNEKKVIWKDRIY